MKETRTKRRAVVIAVGLFGLVWAPALSACSTKSAPASPIPSTGSGAAVPSSQLSPRPDVSYAQPPAPDGMRLVWKFETGAAVLSPPTVWDGVVYFGSNDGYLYSVDGRSGQERWRFNTAGKVLSSPAVADGVVYVGNAAGRLYAVDGSTGQEEWVFETARVAEKWALHGHLSSPAAGDGLIYFHSSDGHLYAIDGTTGRESWRFKTGSRGDSHAFATSPAVGGGLVYVGTASHVYALDARTGRMVWRSATDYVTSPVVSSGVVYSGNYGLDAATGERVWMFQPNTFAMSSAAIAGEVVCVREYPWGNDLRALDRVTGEVRWMFGCWARGGREKCQANSAPSAGEGVFYAGSNDGRLYTLDSQSGDVKSSFAPGLPVSSAPAVSDGIVYFGSYDGSLYAVR